MSRWERDPHVLWRRCNGRILLLAPGHGDVVLIDGVGGVIWELLDVPTAHDELVGALSEHFGRPLAEVDVEVAGFAAELQASGVLVAT